MLGDSPAALAKQDNARVASSKLAQYAYDTGAFAEAGGQLEKLLAAFPKNQDYLRRAGLAFFQAGKHEQALPHWRTLLAGLASDSPDWYEAKYYQLACLAQTDKATARAVWKQFVLLHPDGGPPAWRAKLKDLERRWSER